MYSEDFKNIALKKADYYVLAFLKKVQVMDKERFSTSPEPYYNYLKSCIS